MCYSDWASMVAFSIDIVAAVLLWNNIQFDLFPQWNLRTPVRLVVTNEEKAKDNRVFAYVLVGLSTMQIGEFLIHLDIACDSGLNKVGSHYAYFSLLFLQPVFSGIGLLEGESRTFGTGYNMLLVLWQVIFLAYTAASAHYYVEGEYLSDSLGRNVSKWCTTDVLCDEPTCSLEWEWDDLNGGWKYPMYFILVMGLPIASLKFWEWWFFACVVFFTMQAFWDVPIFKVAASCFWFPALSLLIQLFTPLPELFKDKIEELRTRWKYNLLK